MVYAKLVNGRPVYAPNPITIDGVRIGNPPPEILLDRGYKPIIYTNHGDTPSGYEWTEIWSEDENNIQQGWTLVNIPITEEDALVRYVNEITGQQNTELKEASENLIKIIKENN